MCWPPASARYDADPGLATTWHAPVLEVRALHVLSSVWLHMVVGVVCVVGGMAYFCGSVLTNAGKWEITRQCLLLG